MGENRTSTDKWRRRGLRALLGVLAITFGLIVFLASFFWLPASVNYLITERYVFDAEAPARVALGVLLPVSRPYHLVDTVSVDWDGWQSREPRDQLDVLTFMGNVESTSEKTAIISYHVALRQGPDRWIAPVVDGDLLPQPYIESDDLSIMANASTLAAGASRADVQRIYHFVADYLSSSEDDRICTEPSAAVALQSGQGGCGEFATLMVALSRAAGIPARAMTGVAFPAFSFYPPRFSQTHTWRYPGTGHTWVEFSTQGGWEMADPAWAMPGRSLFGRSDGAHLSYGEIAAARQTLAALHGWAAVVGHEIAAMTMPPKFVASADQEGVTVAPVVTVKKGWDPRWLYFLAGLVLIALMIGLLDARFVRRVEVGEDVT